ncbi:hypothetical protein MLD38_011660 [Melastoma candidum]|uniref:Uncharacterized protein n=1 Tax=Melastoma candidum TaxID=119954 RepID=A0ACB9R3V8_9MYRT|nr:hypothetical protein MLD38_011660 [Melastoma candidum]
MGEVGKVLYLVVVDDDGEKKDGRRGGGGGGEKDSFRYTRPVLQSSLQLMGCKARHAFKISQRVFELMRNETSVEVLVPRTDNPSSMEDGLNGVAKRNAEVEKVWRRRSVPFDLYKRRTTVVVRRETFLDIVCSTLAEYKYVGPNQRADLILACRIREKKESVTVLLCGTSGCGKSTLSALLGSRLGITTVVSTDSIRHMMRSFVDEKQNPLLWASTYHAGEYLDPVAVAEAKAKRKAKKSAGISRTTLKDELADGSAAKDKSPGISSEANVATAASSELISPKQMAIEGFKAQSEMVIESLDRLITGWEERKESVVVEGVHLSLNFVMGLMKKHPSIIPFMIYITNEEKHMERFAVRAKYMTLDPAKNKINNTNVDKSVAAIHATVFSSLRRRERGEQLYDATTNTVALVDEEYRNQCTANSLSSKGMFQLIQRKGSSRHLMALVNADGSVSRAWPVNSVDSNGNPVSGNGIENRIGNPMYGPLKIGKAEPVNLQFGHFGISAWPSDGGTSRAGSVTGSFDDSRMDWTDSSSRYHSSCCSSPRNSDGPAKELKEKLSVHGSDEEADDPPIESDDDLSDDEDKLVQDEVGSVDEESTKSDEEYDDLAMEDTHDPGYWSEDDEPKHQSPAVAGTQLVDTPRDKYSKNLSLFLRCRRDQMKPPLCSYTSMAVERNDSRTVSPGNSKMRRRSQSIPVFGKNGRAGMSDPILSGAPQS